jgi:hypothetical protein
MNRGPEKMCVLLLQDYYKAVRVGGERVVFFIQSSFKFVRYLVLTSTRNNIFTKFSSFLNQIC